ncbi:LysR family regulatory protein [Penicillium frequentans]|uniref:LysR family regulatory protein n=1 Tax=Penicillium frequentans TaxID=3151616 RepID=A0AAD6CTM3_9EURO|nr:LysR family regulatory protein [Penicillium glabrum]
MSINERPLGSKMPECGQGQSVLSPSATEYAPLVLGPNPRWSTPTFHRYSHLQLYSNFCGCHWENESYKAWIAVMEGREEDISPFFSFDHNPTKELGVEYTRERYSNFGRPISVINFVLFEIWYMIETFWYSKVEDHALRIGKKFIEEMRQNVLLEMATPGATEKPFVSEGDIVIAWWVKTMVAALKPSAKRAVTLMNLFSERYPASGVGVIANITQRTVPTFPKSEGIPID